MKLLLSLLMLCFSIHASAWVASNPTEKEYKFKFNFEKEVYEYSMTANTYEQAYEKAAQACFQHYRHGRRVSEDKGLDIIDVCANPRSI